MDINQNISPAARHESLIEIANDWVPPSARPVIVFILVGAGIAFLFWVCFQISKWVSAHLRRKGDDVPPGLLFLLMVVALGGFSVGLMGIYKEQWLAAACLTIPMGCVYAATAACKIRLVGRTSVKTDAMSVETALGTESPGPEGPGPSFSPGQTTPNVPPNNMVPFAPPATTAAKGSAGGAT